MYRSIFCLLSILLLASPAAAVDQPERANRPIPTPSGVESRLTSSTSGPLAARETAGPDTFVLYGGPDHATEGKFQLADGITPDWGDGSGLPRGYGGGPEAWRPVDFTKAPTAWHVDAFNAANLNGHGPGNRAMWCGLAADDLAAGNWVHAPGYGNGWDVSLLYESASIADLSAGQTVSLDFFFNYDTEENYDFFRVEYDRAGVWTPVLEVSGSNKDGSDQFAAPGVQFTTEQTAPIAYLGNDYGGLSGDQIRIRLRFETDLGWSDEDGAHLTTAGAVQVDDISLSHSGGASFEDFEGVGPFDWRWVQPVFAGDFADVYAGLTDIDPCRGNPTPVVGFIDHGQIIRNAPGIDGSRTCPAVRPGLESNTEFRGTTPSTTGVGCPSA